MVIFAAEGIILHGCPSALGTEKPSVMVKDRAGLIVEDRMGDLLEDILLDRSMIRSASLTDTSPVLGLYFDIERVLFFELVQNAKILFVYIRK